jgi:hypothetical protein
MKPTGNKDIVMNSIEATNEELASQKAAGLNGGRDHIGGAHSCPRLESSYIQSPKSRTIASSSTIQKRKR